MHSLLASLVLLIVVILKSTSSQTVDPGSVDGNTKIKWCNDQKSTCPLLCLQIPGASKVPTKNDCDPDSLVYLCLCSNGQQPNASEYSLTIPYHECQEFGNQCVKRCSATDSACQSACRTSNPCGAQNPTRVNISTTSTSSDTATATSTSNKAASTSDSNPADYTGFGADPTATSSSGSGSSDSNSAQALAVSFGRTYGLVLVLAMVCGGFTFML